MKKYLSILLVLVALVAFPVCSFAADNAHAAGVNADISYVNAIGDASSGALAEVSTTSGALNTADRAYATGNTGWVQSVDTLIYTGACRLMGIYVTGETAGDWAAVYDATTADATYLKFDPRIAANTSSIYFDTKGVIFSTGIYVKVLDNQVLCSVVYDY